MLLSERDATGFAGPWPLSSSYCETASALARASA